MIRLTESLIVMAKPLTYYFDKECTKRYPVNEGGTPIIDYGEVIPGKTKQIELYIKNESRDRLILRQPYTLDEDMKIIDFPPSLFHTDSGKVTVEFTPNKERIDALHNDWGFDVVVG